MDPSVAVAPDIFDVVATPDVVLPVVTAHILSPWLWQLGQTNCVAMPVGKWMLPPQLGQPKA